MYKNVVSTQDLLSDSQRTNYSSDSALFSLSQRQHSQTQSDFSQVRTQDLFTQNQSGGSQSESDKFKHIDFRALSQLRKISMYDKWMSKGTAFKKDQACVRPGAKNQPLFQQQYQLGQNRGKDSDDRELLQQVVNIVQDCNKEVKCTLTAVKERLESQSELTGEKLCDTMKAFLEDIWKHEDRMLQALQDRSQSKDKIHELEKQLALTSSQNKEKLHELEKLLAVKDAELKQLHTQLEERGKPGDLKQMAKAVREEMLSPQLAVENKLMEILEVTREASEQQNQQLNQYKDQMTAQVKQYSEWKTFNQRLVKDMEKRLQKDIASVGKDLHKQEQEWMSNLQDQLSETTATYTQDLEKLVEKALNESAGANSKQGSAGNTTAIPSIVATVKKDLQAAVQKQSKIMEKNIKDLLGQQLQKQQQQLDNLHKTLLADVTAEIESAAQRQLQDKDNDDDESLAPLTVPVFEEKFEEYHHNLKRQLEEMHKKHVEEVERIRKNLNLQEPSGSVPSAACKPFSTAFPQVVSSQSFASVGGSYIPKTTGYQLQRRRDTALISPMSELDRSTLFTKAKPSPVVTVLPQQQPTKTSSLTSMRSSLSESDKEPSASEKTTKEQSNQLFSPSASTASCRSSPAVSVTVDSELVVVRRSRWQTTSSSTPKRNSQLVGNNSLDMLSTPCIESNLSQRSLQQSQVEWTDNEPRRSLRKRIL